GHDGLDDLAHLVTGGVGIPEGLNEGRDVGHAGHGRVTLIEQGGQVGVLPLGGGLAGHTSESICSEHRYATSYLGHLARSQRCEGLVTQRVETTVTCQCQWPGGMRLHTAGSRTVALVPGHPGTRWLPGHHAHTCRPRA